MPCLLVVLRSRRTAVTGGTRPQPWSALLIKRGCPSHAVHTTWMWHPRLTPWYGRSQRGECPFSFPAGAYRLKGRPLRLKGPGANALWPHESGVYATGPGTGGARVTEVRFVSPRAAAMPRRRAARCRAATQGPDIQAARGCAPCRGAPSRPCFPARPLGTCGCVPPAALGAGGPAAHQPEPAESAGANAWSPALPLLTVPQLAPVCKRATPRHRQRFLTRFLRRSLEAP